MVRPNFKFLFAACILAATCEGTASAAVLSLVWDPPTSGTASSYMISYGTQSGVYTTHVSAGSNTSHTVTELTSGVTYYFVVRALNSSGTPSNYSNELAATPPFDGSLLGDSSPESPSLAPSNPTPNPGLPTTPIPSPGAPGAINSLTLTPNVSAPQVIGATIVWSAAATGGTAPYQYQWWLSDGATTTAVTDWRSSNTFSWTPNAANASYVISVRARSAGDTSTAGSASASFPFPVSGPSVAATPIAPPANTPVTISATQMSFGSFRTGVRFKATVSGSAGPYQYRWSLFDGASWTTLSEWKSSNTFLWLPNGPSDLYAVRVTVKNSTGNELTSQATSVPVAARTTARR